MKKINIYLLSMSIGLSCSFLNVKATPLNSVETSEITTIKDEYSMLLDELETFDEKFESVLRMNSSEASIYHELKQSIENYPNFIYEQQKLSNEELKSQFYTDQQIAAIRAFDGDKRLIPYASASVNATIIATEFYHSYYNNTFPRTYIKVKYSGSWSGTPLIRNQDTISIGINGTTSNYLLQSSTGKVTFDNGITLSNLNFLDDNQGCRYKFGMQYNGSTMRTFEFTYFGFGDTFMSAAGYEGTYAHAIITGSVGFGLDISDSRPSYGISFEINNGFNEMNKDDGVVEI